MRYLYVIIFICFIAQAKAVDTAPPVISYTNITTPSCTFTNMTLSGVVISDATGIPLSGTLVPRIYYKKNGGAWFSKPGTNTSGTLTNSTWSFTIMETDFGGVTGGDIVSYYIIAQDIVVPANVGAKPSAGLSATSVNTVSSHPTTPNTYTLKYNLNGTYSVGIGGNFTTLTAAINAYNNACSLAGPVIFELTDNSYPSETFPININNHPDASNAHPLTIRPSVTATPVITGSPATQLININGGRYITLDGRQAGIGSGKALSFINNNTSGTTIQFINDAQNNRLQYCVVKGSAASGSRAVVSFGTSAASGTGNDNNVVDNNDICDGAANPANAIYSAGTASRTNDNITISNNNIFNYFKADNRSVGINVFSNSSTWIITGNHLYQTATRLYTAASDHYAMWLNTGDGYTISNNVIGFANSAGTGTTKMIGNSTMITGFPGSYAADAGISIRYIAITCSFISGGVSSSIDGNTIGGIALYTSSAGFPTYGMLCGIYIETGNATIGTNTGNVIGSTSGAASIYAASTAAGAMIVGIRAGSTGSVNIQNNTVGGISTSGTANNVSTGITGISTGGAGSFIISNNFIGNAGASNMKMGWLLSGGNLSNTGTLNPVSDATAAFTGITGTSSSGPITITNNTLQGWAVSNTTAGVSGITASVTGAFANADVSINNNFIGSSVAGWLNYASPNSGVLSGIGISNSSVVSATYTINTNDIRGISYASPVANSGINNFIGVAMSSTSNNNVSISNNTFTNLDINTTGNTCLIFHSYSVGSSGVQTINNNSISGTFNRSGSSGILYLLSSNAASVNGAHINHTNNNFSNITITGSSSIAGFQNADGSSNPLKTITGNTCNNWTCGTGYMRVFDYDYFGGAAPAVSNNIITNIYGQGSITGILLSNPANAQHGNASVLNVKNNLISGLISSGPGGDVTGISFNTPATLAVIESNTINNLSSTGAGVAVNAIITGGTSTSAINIFKNKIFALSASDPGASVNGINISAGTTLNVMNNMVGDLKTPAAGGPLPSVTGLTISGGTTVNAFYNTIYLNGLSTHPSFSCAALYVNTTTGLNLRNNIFNNISTPGSSGKTVVYWRSSADLSTYAASSNTNLFYAGNASATRLIYFDGTNSDQLFTDFQARVASKDAQSISEQPTYSSITGDDADFLHLNPFGNCNIADHGDNTGIVIADDFDNDSRAVATPFITDIGADEIGKTNVWTGAIDGAWNNSLNWSQGYVPNRADINVSITNVPASQPVILAGEIFQVGNITIGSGALLTNRGTLRSAGIITAGPGQVNNILAGIVTGSIELNGTCTGTQTLPGNIFANNSIKNLTISNNVNFLPGNADSINITGALSFGAVSGKTLNTADNLVLISSAAATANVADVTGNFITGKATVERYINTGLIADGRHLKSWQFLSVPTVAATIFGTWQENGAAPPGYGTIITGTGSGFDASTVNPSMKYYDPNSNSWTAITNTASLISNSKGYMIFVRGDRSVTAYNQNAVPTTLRTKGFLYQPSLLPPVSSVQPGLLESVGNPYASAIDLVYMKNNGLFFNLDNDVTVWDPLLAGSYNVGGYQTLSAANNYEPTAGNTAFYPAGVPVPLLQSGQAFFVHSSGAAGSVTFNELCKVSGSRLVNRLQAHSERQYFRAALYTGNGTIADGNAVVFDPDFSNNIDADDSYKVPNSGENFCLIRQRQQLSVEARRSVGLADSIFYNMDHLRLQPYQLRFAPKNMQHAGVSAYLVDTYLHSEQQLSLTDSSFINFTVNTDPASSATGRFYVIFRRGKTAMSLYSFNDPVFDIYSASYLNFILLPSIKKLM